MAEKNIQLALCAFKNVFVEKKNNVATTCRDKQILLRNETKKIFRLRKKNSPPPPLS